MVFEINQGLSVQRSKLDPNSC